MPPLGGTAKNQTDRSAATTHRPRRPQSHPAYRHGRRDLTASLTAKKSAPAPEKKITVISAVRAVKAAIFGLSADVLYKIHSGASQAQSKLTSKSLWLAKAKHGLKPDQAGRTHPYQAGPVFT